MPCVLPDDARRQALTSLQRFAAQELDVELGNLQATALLDFVLKDIAPSVYNQAVADAQAFLRDRLADLEATCYEPEFTYWPRGTSVRRK